MKKNNNMHKVVLAAMFSALVCVATMIIQIPSPLKGYINMGDGIVLLAGWLLPPPYGFLAAGIGAMFADIFAGYIIYAPATFIIKGTMALVAWYSLYFLSQKMNRPISRFLSAIIAQNIMILGYFFYEALLYNVALAAMNVTGNLVQACAGIIVGILMINAFEKSGLNMWLR